MKALIYLITSIFSIVFVGLSVSAQDFPWSEGDFEEFRVGRGDVRCLAVDSKWEEHRRGHVNCAQCLRAHDSCMQICQAQFFECAAVGIDHRGNTYSFRGRDSNRWRAEEIALYSCERQGFRACQNRGCRAQAQEVSRRVCR